MQRQATTSASAQVDGPMRTRDPDQWRDAAPESIPESIPEST